ncbi:MAG: pyrroloquinoline quinone biosynthesis protein PqqE [Pseudomonas sp.]|uniref:pyrroloquinoline quinone biosynthesis protein PqqE n=1 Tax=Pseudomonas abieticivorans TaxID=2931382 RepID=UPI0020BD4834|nr:pyrroloquinoline quinone biosynthesis protein PqqE [Pseudomonas sp. PIA16]MDE1166996.1 pyrroloquinoline quinone biosynthesis protein PqqE [Pseudomonas sp.]
MQISGGSAYYAGLSAIQSGVARADQAASQIASSAVDRSTTNQSTVSQADRLFSVDRSQQQNLAGSSVELVQAKVQVEAGVKVEKASDEMLGTLIDTYA